MARAEKKEAAAVASRGRRLNYYIEERDRTHVSIEALFDKQHQPTIDAMSVCWIEATAMRGSHAVHRQSSLMLARAQPSVAN